MNEIIHQNEFLRFFSVKICKKKHTTELQQLAFKWGWCWSTNNREVSHEDKPFILFYRFKAASDGVHRRRLRYSDNRNNKHIRSCARHGIPVFRSDRDLKSIEHQISLGYVPKNQISMFSVSELRAIELKVFFKEGKAVGLANPKGERVDKIDLRNLVKNKELLYNQVTKRLEYEDDFGDI